MKIAETDNARVRIAAVLFVFAAALPSFAEGRGIDAKGEYYEDSSGDRHYYLFQKESNAKRWSIDNNVYSRVDVTNGAKGVSWVNNSIFSFAKEASYSISEFAVSPNAVMYGFEFETLNGGSAPHVIQFNGSSAKYTIGEYGIHSVSGNTLLFLRQSDGEELHLAASQTWSGDDVSTLSSAPFVIVPNYAYSDVCRGWVTSADDVTLTVAGDTVVAWLSNLTNDNPTVTAHPLTNMDMVIRSPAIVSVGGSSGYGYANLNMRKVTIDGGYGIKFGADKSFVPRSAPNGTSRGGATTYGIGSVPLISPVRIAETIVLTNGATLAALDETTVTGGVRIVSAGLTENSLSGSYSLADTETVFLIEEGATLDLTGATFTGIGSYYVKGSGTVKLNAEQAAFAKFVDFTGTIDAPASRLFVLDEDVSGEVAVAKGETLLVLGNGLGGNATVALANGATVMFKRSATISSPITATGTVYLRTESASVTGTVAGVYTDIAPASGVIDFVSPGLLVMSGGGTLGSLHMQSGNVDITGSYTTVRTQYFYGGHMTIRDGGSLTVKSNYCDTRLDCNTAADACLEIATGGSFSRTGSTCCTYVGTGNTAHESKLLVTGGSFAHNYNTFSLSKGGVVEVVDGTLSTKRRITCTSDTASDANIILRGGVMWFTGSSNYCASLFDGEGFCMVTVDGCPTLRWSAIVSMPDSNDEIPQATWRSTPGSRLRIEGYAHTSATITLHNFEADGLFFDLNTGDYNTSPVKVVMADPHSPLGVGFVCPGKKGSIVTTTGTVPDLAASYFVPAGSTFDIASQPDGWYSGFGNVSVSNLVFEAGSTLRFPFFGNSSSLAISGVLALPGEMNYEVAVAGERREAKSEPVVVPALGFAGDADCTFICNGGTMRKRAMLAAADGALRFSYTPQGLVMSVR